MKKRIVENTHRGKTVFYIQYRLYFLWWDEPKLFTTLEEAKASLETPVIKIHNI